MRYREIPGIHLAVSELILGTLAFRPEHLDHWSDLLDRYVGAGGNAIDTGRVYEGGASELTVGAWLARRGRRDDLVVITKGAHPDADGLPRVNPDAIAADLGASLVSLGLDRIDLYMLHRDDPTVPVGAIIDCLNANLAAGRISAFGASNWTHRRLGEANAYAIERGLAGFVASSPNLALAVPQGEIAPNAVSVAGDKSALAWYRSSSMPLLAWSSGASGFFSGRFTPDGPTNPSVAPYFQQQNWQRLARVQSLARTRGCTTTQVALAWVLHQSFPTFALIGPRAPDELEDCLGCLSVDLSDRESQWLNLESEDLVSGLTAPADTLPNETAVLERARYAAGVVVANQAGSSADSPGRNPQPSQPMADTAMTSPKPDASPTGELRSLLQEIALAQRDLSVGDQLPPGEGILGIVSARVKRPFHRLAQFYVDLFAQRQHRINLPLARAVDLLASEVAAQREELRAIRRDSPGTSSN